MLVLSNRADVYMYRIGIDTLYAPS